MNKELKTLLTRIVTVSVAFLIAFSILHLTKKYNEPTYKKEQVHLQSIIPARTKNNIPINVEILYIIDINPDNMSKFRKEQYGKSKMNYNSLLISGPFAMKTQDEISKMTFKDDSTILESMMNVRFALQKIITPYVILPDSSGLVISDIIYSVVYPKRVQTLIDEQLRISTDLIRIRVEQERIVQRDIISARDKMSQPKHDHKADSLRIELLLAQKFKIWQQFLLVEQNRLSQPNHEYKLQ